MYRARVEQVSGLKVRAGGKWLTCIGNKNVRAGDTIWTDGRCVYGNNQTPQQPIVIPTTQEELGIPICLPYDLTRESSISFAEYRHFKKNVYFVSKIQGDTLPEFIDPVWGLQNDAHYLMSNNKNECIFSNAPLAGRTQEYLDYRDCIGRTALNIDSDNNVYKIQLESVRDGILTTGNYRVQILKNSTVIKTFYVNWNEIEEVFVPYQDWFHWHSFVENLLCVSSFIENENNWWIVFLVATDFFAYSAGEFWQVRLMIINNNTKQNLFTCKSGEISIDREIKIPMHDGFYFKIDNATVKYPRSRKNLEVTTTFKIYSPQDLELMTINFDSKTDGLQKTPTTARFYFAGYQISPHRFLISSLQDGLFLCTKESWEQIFNGKIANQALRPMKKYKRWWERIQTLE